MRLDRYILASYAVAACILLPSELPAEGKETATEEEQNLFPDVDLAEGSIPRYVALATSPFDNSQAAYVMFDGDTDRGYKRVYVWVPDNLTYGRPKPFRINSEGNFGPVEFENRQDNLAGRLAWQLSWYRGSQTAGTVSHFDYRTGKNVTSTRKAGTWSVFGFMLNYAYGNPAKKKAAVYPLDIIISGQLQPTTGNMTAFPAPLAPWENLAVSAEHEVYQGRKDEGGLRLTTGLYRHNSKVEIRSLPDDAVIKLEVFPYLEDAVFSKDFTDWEDVFVKGVEVPLKYGWYEWQRTFSCDGLPPYDTGRGGLIPVARYPL